ncbi:GntR family transcriptional regulator, partial [Paraburkholderia graminis]
MRLEIQLDRDNGVPLTEQIVAGVSTWIRSRTAHPGSKLPSIRQFAADYGVSRFPVIEAYDRLVSLGYIDSRHGSGFYVADRPPGGAQCDGTSDPRRAEEESD